MGSGSCWRERHADVPYISSSADDYVSGHGPYRAMPINHYFMKGATPKMHSEMGMPNIMTLDSLKATMPEQAMWPLGRMFGLHDFSLDGAQGGASFIERIQKSYGGVDNIADWATIAQFVNYEGYRGMFEAQSRNRMGLLIWMSHPAWPSLVWQTYDYFFEPTAGYFGAKKAAEPCTSSGTPTTEAVEVVNYNGGDATGLTARREVREHRRQRDWQKTAQVDSKEDSTRSVIEMEYPLGATPVHFIRLQLDARDRRRVRELLLARAGGRELPATARAAKGAARCDDDRDGDADGYRLSTELSTTGARPRSWSG